MQFKAKLDFYCEELQSQYCSGMTYTIRPQATRLATLVPQWVQDGKVELRVGAPVSPAIVSGTGSVKTPSWWERLVAQWL